MHDSIYAYIYKHASRNNQRVGNIGYHWKGVACKGEARA